jgi:ferredoxin
MTKIYYFSGTGNSLWSAKKIKQLIEDPCELYNIGTEAQKNGIVIEADAVIFVFPSYAYGMPIIVRRFAESAVFKTKYVAALVTYGSSPLGTLGGLRRILKKKGIDKMFFARIPAVENYLAMFGPPNAKTIECRSRKQEKATEQAAQSIIERKENRVSTFAPFSSFVSWLFSFGIKIFYKHYRVSSSCNGCAVCERICPVCAITIKDGLPVFSHNCEHCQACVNICPLRAIQFGRVKFGTPGYCHPEIKIDELER